jgi:hypothetical protein
MTSRETSDVYSTGEPMKEFDRRIGFLLDLYNQRAGTASTAMGSGSTERSVFLLSDQAPLADYALVDKFERRLITRRER